MRTQSNQTAETLGSGKDERLLSDKATLNDQSRRVKTMNNSPEEGKQIK